MYKTFCSLLFRVVWRVVEHFFHSWGWFWRRIQTGLVTECVPVASETRVLFLEHSAPLTVGNNGNLNMTIVAAVPDWLERKKTM